MTASPSNTGASASVKIPRHHRLILIRHAQSAVDPQRPPAEWGLTEDGEAAARRLAALGLLDRAMGFYAGPEPKMIQSLEPAVIDRRHTVQADAAFAETHSEGFLGNDQFLAAVQRVFTAPDEPPAPRWETATAACSRFAAGVDRLRQVHEPDRNGDRVVPGTVVICTGGRMLISYLAAVLDWSAAEAMAHWRALKMPDLAVLELDEQPEDAQRPKGVRGWGEGVGKGDLVIPFGTLVV